MVATLRYPVVVVERDGYDLAWLPDLRCKTLGSSPAGAVASVEIQALAVLREYEGHPIPLPAASRLVIGCVELPAPPQLSVIASVP